LPSETGTAGHNCFAAKAVQGAHKADPMKSSGELSIRPCAISSAKRVLRRAWTGTVWRGACVSPGSDT